MTEPEIRFNERLSRRSLQRAALLVGACLAIVVGAAVTMGASPSASPTSPGATATPDASADPGTTNGGPWPGIERGFLGGRGLPRRLRGDLDHSDQRLEPQPRDRGWLDAHDLPRLDDHDHEGRQHDPSRGPRGRRQDQVRSDAQLRRHLYRDRDPGRAAERRRDGHRQDRYHDHRRATRRLQRERSRSTAIRPSRSRM